MRYLIPGKPWLALFALLVVLALPPLAAAATVTEAFDVGSFDKILVLSPYDVEVVQDANFSVEVTVDRRYEDSIQVEAAGSVLTLSVTPEPFNASTLVARVTMPALDSIEILGVGDATLSGFNQRKLAVSILGAARVSGSSMWIDELDLTVVGTGGADFGDIAPIQRAEVGLDGVNESTLNMAAGSTISAMLMGITRLNYYGSDVRLDVTKIGLSQVRWLGESGGGQAAPPVGSGHSGSWYAAAQSGHGFSIEVGVRANGTPLVVVNWYTYDDVGNPIFLIGTGVPDGGVLEVEFQSPVGMVFGEFDPGSVVREPGGVGRFEFSDEDNAVFDYTPSVFTSTAWGHTPVESLPLVKLFSIGR